MFTNRKSLFFIIILFLWSSCNQSGTSHENLTNQQPLTQPEPVTAEINPIPNDVGVELVSNCTGAEATFYTVGGSISTGSCSIFFSYLEQNQPTRLIKEEFGHIAFLKGGEVLCMAKIHMSDGANYIKFTINNEVYYHNLSQKGIDFFKNIDKYQEQ
jgi:hypothetical protein